MSIFIITVIIFISAVIIRFILKILKNKKRQYFKSSIVFCSFLAIIALSAIKYCGSTPIESTFEHKYTDTNYSDPETHYHHNDDDNCYDDTYNNAEKPYIAKTTVDFLDKLKTYSEYDHTNANFGNIIRSTKEVNNNDETYRYYYDTGWEKSLTIATCYKCNGDGECKQFHGIPGGPALFCVACGNTGLCNVCNGSGKWIFVTSYNPQTGESYSINGTKNHYNNHNQTNYNTPNNFESNSSTTNTSINSVCSYCGGSGVCSSCHGTGGHWESTGYYTGSESKTWIECPSCMGNAKCFNCHGSGKQR